jgi:nitroreductase
VDTAIPMQNILLVAVSEELATCWVSSFKEGKVKELLKSPRQFSVVALLAVGYAREKLDFTAKVAHFIRRKKDREDHEPRRVWNSVR